LSPPLLDVQGLTKHFPITAGWFRKEVGAIKAVDGVSFQVESGETFGLVGESGCGKTTTGRLILRLIERTAGSLRYRTNTGVIDLAALHGEELRQFRRNMQMIFQDPFSSLDPRMTVMDIIGEPLRAQGVLSSELRDRVKRATVEVGLRMEYLNRYPHAFSGGQRQRIGIARALVLQPKLVVCDEPVSALDVSVQAQILNLLMDLQQRHGLTYVFIAHNLAIVEHISHRVAVMYAGRIVELAATEPLFERPMHPYTEALLAAVPVQDPRRRGKRSFLEGELADLSNLPAGCSFHPRCRYCRERCRTETPLFRSVEKKRAAACHFSEEIFGGP
jgi:peptide/nickel transport system ATP-binding protein